MLGAREGRLMVCVWLKPLAKSPVACLGFPEVLLTSSGESPQEATAPDMVRPFLGQECVGIGDPDATRMRLGSLGGCMNKG